MKHTKFEEQYISVLNMLNRTRVSSALRIMLRMCDEDSILAEYKPSIIRLQETYGYLARFTIGGYDDPTRSHMLSEITGDARSILTAMQRTLRSIDIPTLYYSTLRTNRHVVDNSSVTQLLAAVRKLAAQVSVAQLGDMTSEAVDKLNHTLQYEEHRAFMELWTAFPLTVDDIQSVQSFIDDKVVDNAAKSMVAGALFLGVRETFDVRRLNLLLDIYQRCDADVALRALVYLLIAVSEADADQLAPLASRFETLAEDQRWRSDVALVFRQLLNTRDTERISRKIADEILPSMEDLGREMKKRSKDGVITESDIFESEEIMSMIENSSFSEKMKEMNEIQKHGGDIMLTTFSQLKNFTFFRTISNWFLPYTNDRMEVNEALHRMPALADLLAGVQSLCDNDLYSLVFAMERMPAAQQEMFSSQLGAASEQLAQLQASKLQPDEAERSDVIERTTQNLYRFFTLYERHNEFRNPFATALNLMGVDLLKSSLSQDELTRHAATFYYTHGYYNDALPLLLHIENNVDDEHAPQIYFCIGDCYYRRGDYSNALTYFQRSELFDDKNRDTQLRLALVNRLLDNHKKAVAYFRNTILMTNETSKKREIEMLLCAELVDSERYAEAIELFYRLDFDKRIEDSRHIHKVALAELKMGNYAKCEKLIARIDKPGCDDILLLAESHIGKSDFDAAVNDIVRLLKSYPDFESTKFDLFVDEVLADIVNAKIDKNTVNIIIDEAFNRAV